MPDEIKKRNDNYCGFKLRYSQFKKMSIIWYESKILTRIKTKES